MEAKAFFRYLYIFVLLFLLGAILVFVIGGIFSKPKKTETHSGVILDESSLTPTQIKPTEVGEKTTPTITYTLDCSQIEEWVYFDFSRGSVIKGADKNSLDWDLAFKRAKILTNGGETNKKGLGGALVLESVKFETIAELPENASFEKDYKSYNKLEKENKALDKWYEYNYLNHRLEPKPSIYIIKTADGRFAKMQILSYYCEGEKAGCFTFRYVYQGKKSNKLVL